MNQNEILQMLSENTHVLFTRDFLDKLNKAFGTDIKPDMYPANPSDPKGLTLDNGAAEAEGISALDASWGLCRSLKVKFDSKLGRGSQVRACIEGLRAAGYGLTEQSTAATE